MGACMGTCIRLTRACAPPPPEQEVLGRVVVSSVKNEPFMSRVEFKNRWLVGEQHGLRHDGLDNHAAVDVTVEWKKDDGGRGVVRLRLFPWLSYACAPGSRLKIAQHGHEFDGSCATVQVRARSPDTRAVQCARGMFNATYCSCSCLHAMCC